MCYNNLINEEQNVQKFKEDFASQH